MAEVAFPFVPVYRPVENAVGVYRYWLALKLLMIFGGLVWCVEIFRRRRRDIAAVREPSDEIERIVVIGYWIVTAVIVALLAVFVPSVLREFLQLLRF